MKTLKELRTSYNLTQEELADLFGVSAGTIYNMEKDSTEIKDSLLKKYIQAFDVKYDEIFLGKEYEKNVFIRKKKNEFIQSFQIKYNSGNNQPRR